MSAPYVNVVPVPKLSARAPAVTVKEADGGFTIYVKAELGDEARRHLIEHELNHINAEHFYREDAVALREIEAGAENVRAVDVVTAGGVNKIPLYESPEAYVRHFATKASNLSLKRMKTAGFKP